MSLFICFNIIFAKLVKNSQKNIIFAKNFEVMTFKEVFKKLANKYIIATLIFAAVIVFFDQFNIFEQGRSYRKIKKLDKDIEQLDQKIEADRQTLYDLKNDSAAVEKVAREQHFMKRDDEVIYYLDKGE
jgi:cell division protein FtsB